jgi:hypothetical protein
METLQRRKSYFTNLLMGDLELSALDFVEIPSLYWKAVVTNGFQACVPGMMNLLVDGYTLVLAKPFGPRDGLGDALNKMCKRILAV